MNFSFFIAKRYFSSYRGKGIVNIISIISLAGVAIGTAALIIILSVFNGFERVILDMYNSFDPHLKITYRQGKTFDSVFPNDILSTTDGVKVFSNVIEEDIFFSYKNSNDFAVIKGVDKQYKSLNNFEKLLIHPHDQSDTMGVYFDEPLPTILPNNIYVYPCNLGISLAFENSINIVGSQNNFFKTVLPKRNSNYIRSESDMVYTFFNPVGLFASQSEYDGKYIISSIEIVRKMLDLDSQQISSIEIMINNINDIQIIKNNLSEKLGEDYIISTRLEQHDFLYKLLNSERLAIFIILTFIFIIASFNIVSSLSMLIIEKKDDIKVLSNLGSSKKQIQNIFFLTGFRGVIFGSAVGIFLGLIFCGLQQHLHIIQINGNFVVDHYPIRIDYFDIMIIEIIVLTIGFLATYYPAKVLIRKFLPTF